MTEEFAKETIPVNLEDEMRQSYLDYAMSVIVGRALPDVRDGMKPVHRRVLFAMHELSNDYNKPYKKSARVVGDVIGKYHPHGDTAVYDTIVRMAQSFSLRYPLVDGQGNFGSVDGDSPAAMRYTEIRMARIAHEMLADLEKETVDYSPNYDGTEQIPDVMPTKLPNLLVNGSAGIAVGMATNIPPHNLNEVIDGCLALLENENTSIDDLMKIIPGPDFPTAGIINGIKGIRDAYRTGRGRIYVRARVEVETEALLPVRKQIAHEYLGLLHEPMHQNRALGGIQGHSNRQLAPVVDIEAEVVVRQLAVDLGRTPDAAHGVAGQRLDLDDPGAKVGQYGTCARSRHVVVHFQDRNVVEGCAHVLLPLNLLICCRPPCPSPAGAHPRVQALGPRA